MFASLSDDEIDSRGLLTAIRVAKRKLQDAKTMKCICSGTAIQYEGGCVCERGKAINRAHEVLNHIIESV